MNQQDLQQAIERYKREAMQTAARSPLPLEREPEESLPSAEAPLPPAEAPLASEELPLPLAEPEELPPDINPPESGPGEDPLQEISPVLVSSAEFREASPKSGVLCIQAAAAGSAIPVKGARVVVSKAFSDGVQIFADNVTDENGILDNIILPAPDKEIGEHPSRQPPYAYYDVQVSHPQYRTEVYQDVPIFDGIKSIQPVRFVPYQDKKE